MQALMKGEALSEGMSFDPKGKTLHRSIRSLATAISPVPHTQWKGVWPFYSISVSGSDLEFTIIST